MGHCEAHVSCVKCQAYSMCSQVVNLSVDIIVVHFITFVGSLSLRATITEHHMLGGS